MSQRGERNSQAKLTKDDIWEILVLLRKRAKERVRQYKGLPVRYPRALTQRQIAAKFGVTQPQVSQIKNHVCWPHVTKKYKRRILDAEYDRAYA